MKYIDNFLNQVTMYRLVLYYLIFLVLTAIIYSFLGVLPYNWFDILFSTLLIVGVCWFTNHIFSQVFHVPANVESVYISALILALIIRPIINETHLEIIFWASVWAMASKYIIALQGKHLFNPVAVAVFITSIFLNSPATWWVGTYSLLPFTLTGCFLISRKIRRFPMVFSFLITALITIICLSFLNGRDPFVSVQKAIGGSALFFFAAIMLTEPLTTPPTRRRQIVYGLLTGFLFPPQVHLGGLYTTPESALLIGNLYSYLVSPKTRLILTLKSKLQLAPDIYDFIFTSDKKLDYTPGQYLEWTISPHHADSRGNRRYFTLSSSPTEPDVRIGVKFYPNSSSYKVNLHHLAIGDTITASQLSGDFILPKNSNQKLIFIAGGIGITPFRSIAKYLIDTHQNRSVILFYSNKLVSDIVYKDVFDQATSQLDFHTIYTITDNQETLPPWVQEQGRITPEMIQKYVPDYKDRTFYLSGPHNLVSAFEVVVSHMGISQKNIVTDYFPGFV